MAKWNMFSEEVNAEKRIIQAYGGPLKVADRHGCSDSYKAQALRELSNRLLLSDELNSLRRRLDAAIDLLDGVTPSELGRLTGLDNAKVEKLLLKVYLV